VTKVIRAGPPPPRRAWLDVDLAALVRNARRFRELCGTPLLPMVKANGYGLGAVPVARALEPESPWGFGVATIEEGAELRSAGITRPILVFTPLAADPVSVSAMQSSRLCPVIADIAALDGWLAAGAAPFHIEIDTGMSRSGFSWREPESLSALAGRLRSAGGWEGACTHFHSADCDAASVRVQADRFARVLADLPRRPRLVHAANSAAGAMNPELGGDVARPGIFLYGGRAGVLEPEPVARLAARIIALRQVQTGDSVSYGAEWIAPASGRIATVSIGYGDGVPRALGNRGLVEINGRSYPIAGRVTMDMLMVDLGPSGPPVGLGDLATLFGGMVTLDEQARRAGTVSYELLTAVSPRVARVYHGRSGEGAR